MDQKAYFTEESKSPQSQNRKGNLYKVEEKAEQLSFILV